MYFPYLRSKQHELQALLEINQELYENNRVIPIIEPTAINGGIDRRLTTLCQRGIRFILIVNPTAHQSPVRNIVEEHFIDNVLNGYDNYLLGFIIDENTAQESLLSFLNQYPHLQKVFVHRGEYRGGFEDILNNILEVEFNIYCFQKVTENYVNETCGTSSKILISDGFQRQKKNADYPNVSVFNNLSLNFRELGYSGFGDYLMVGDYFRQTNGGGGGAYVMALHVTSRVDDNILVRHFLSDVNSTNTANQGGKFSEALNELIEFMEENNSIVETTGIQRYIECHQAEHFPGNGMNKRYAMMHHIEQIVSNMN